MRVLVIGSGGREHAIVWKVSQSKKAEKIFCIPGNPGISEIASCVKISISDFPAILEFVKKEKIDLTIVGPEVPLVSGLADYFKENNQKIFGPSKKGALLEGSKVFSKQMMKKYGVPTADFEIFSGSKEAIKYIENKSIPRVIKADGLAAGKGAIVAKTMQEAINAIKQILDEKIFGDAGNEIVIEDFIKGEEVSSLAIFDNKTFIPLIPSQDHKQIFDNDKGPNTGGMGSYAPAPILNNKLQDKVNKEVFQRMLSCFREEKIAFNGVLFAGLMINGDDFGVLEFNARFGDPETQTILPLMQTDLLDVLNAAAENNLENIKIEWSDKSCVCVVLASKGYPNDYEKGKEIKGLEEIKKINNAVVFHAGTAIKDGKIVTSGGRVLGVTAIDENLKAAQAKAYDAVKKISFEGMQYRKDIASKEINRTKGINELTG